MSLSVRGSTARLARQVRALGSAVRAVLPDARAELAERYLESFGAQRSPDGARWPARQAGGRAGFVTGALAAPRITQAGRDGLRLRAVPRYAYYFAFGRRGQPPRGLVPESGAGLWDEPLRGVIAEAMLRRVRRAVR